MIKEERVLTQKSIAYLFALAVLIGLFISSFLHFWQIGNTPPGLFIDEASLGYNSYAMALTGMDEYGETCPLFFKCFGYYNDPVMIYSMIPFIKIWGLSITTCRISSGIYHLLAAIAFFFLANRYSRNRWISLIGAFLFSLIPWVFPLSRSVIGGYTPMLLGIILGWYCLIKSFSQKSYCWAIFAGISWAFAMYSHNIGRPMSALLLVIFVGSFNFRLIKRWKVFVTFVLSFVISLIPMIISVAQRSASMTNRFNSISVWRDSPSFSILALRFFSRYLDYFSPPFLFITGDSNPRHNTGNSGELFIFLVPFILVGLFILIRHFRRNPYYRFALLGLLAYPAAAILTLGRCHGTRTIHGSIFWCLVAVIGINFSWQHRKKVLPFIVAISLFAVYEIFSYYSFYFQQYPSLSRKAFGANLNEALTWTAENVKKNETVYVSSTIFYTDRVTREFKPFWYANILFIFKINPETYQKMQQIPQEIIAPYNGTINNPGFLIISDKKVVFDQNGKAPALAPNSEKIPENAELIASSEAQGRKILIFKVNK